MSKFRESELLASLARMVPRHDHVPDGVADQDDGAVVQIPPGHELCATSDFVRGTGFELFRRGLLSLADVGRYLVAANVSDLAAMGARPHAFLAVLRYAPERTLEDVEELVRSIVEACEAFNCPLVGGDSGSYEADVLSGTALGVLPAGRRLSRRNLRVGDVILVSGEIGGAAAALTAALSGVEVPGDAMDNALKRWRAPEPRVELGIALLATGHRIACMDISDGLTASLQQLTRVAGGGFEIDAASLPIAGCVQTIAGALGKPPASLACGASVDFELLVGCSRDALANVLAAASTAGVPLTVIGGHVAEPGIVERNGGGRGAPLAGVPWDHQSSDLALLLNG